MSCVRWLVPRFLQLGCPRSGTTLPQRLVNAHPLIAITPAETHGEDIRYKFATPAKSRCDREWGDDYAKMDQDSKPWSEARAPG